ncbi:MAG: PepSY-associated TM helix domain-containing protein [Gammaproteobacteria bacterium]|nr:PepSY-associated TM helix domain-containing protein [Gammaproteobacteria bacterium]
MNSLTTKLSWIRHPQRLRFRKFLFQIHLWSGICLGLYIFFISITGSVLVYRNELYVMATPSPIISTGFESSLSEDLLIDRVILLYPGYEITRMNQSGNTNQAIEIWLEMDDNTIKRFFDPFNGNDIGSAERTGQMLVVKLIELHESFLIGPMGRKINGIGAIAVLIIVFTGLVIWWPGINRWRRSLSFRTGIGWKRQIWDIHSMVGIWSFLFILMFAFSGVYLSFPDFFHELGDKLQPITAENAGSRFVNKFLYWLAFLHFGRINGIGLVCSGPGLCDQSIKAIWALFGLAPTIMFATGATMWWNRVLRRWLKRTH